MMRLTTRDTPADTIAGLDAGPDDYLVKPLDPGELLGGTRVGARVLGLQERLAVHPQYLPALLQDAVRISMPSAPPRRRCQAPGPRTDQGRGFLSRLWAVAAHVVIADGVPGEPAFGFTLQVR